MQGGPKTLEVLELEPAAMEEITEEDSGPKFLEKCEVLKKPTQPGDDVELFGIRWSVINPDTDGIPQCYLCEDRAMKIVANLRQERGERIKPSTEWLLFRMGGLIGRSTDVEVLLKKASEM